MASRSKLLTVLGVISFVVYGGSSVGGRAAPEPTATRQELPPAAPRTKASEPRDRISADASDGCITLEGGSRLCAPSVKLARDSATAPRVGSGRDLLRRFFGESNEVGACTSKYELSVSIAMLPDPMDSHMDWAFDAGIESLSRAFEAAGFVGDRYWLPWAGSTSSSSGADRATRGDEPSAWALHPGAMLFRGAELVPKVRRLHLVYVVGEVPTTGLQMSAFREALAEREALLSDTLCTVRSSGADADTLRLIGPTFSGTSPGLRLALESWRARPAATLMRARIITGAATADDNKRALEDSLTTFSASVYPAGTSLRWLIDTVLVERMRISPGQIALLTEGTTQFGQVGQRALTAGNDEPLLIPFPINIASLRTEYARNPAAPTRGDESAPRAPPPRVPLNLLDPARPLERPALASTQLTVPAMELAVREIARALAAHHVRAVGIVATDVRDQLFLAEILKDRLRDVQLFMVGGNLLFLRPDYNAWLRGTLVLSTYPLFLESQFWDLTRTDRGRLIFTSEIAQGIYNATLMQLDSSTTGIDYVAPLGVDSAGRPRLWLTAVGRDAFYPIVTDGSPRGSATTYLQPLDTARRVPRREAERSGGAVEFVVLALVLMVAFPVGYVVLQQRTRGRLPARELQELRERLNRLTAAVNPPLTLARRALTAMSLMQQREMFVALRFIAICGVALATALAVLRPAAHGGDKWQVWVLLASGLVPLAVAGVVVIARRSGRRWSRLRRMVHCTPARPDSHELLLWRVDTAGLWLFFLVGLGFVVMLVWYLGQVLTLGPLENAIYFERAVHLGGGVSPLAPLILGSIGLMAWAWWHVERVELLDQPTEFEEACLADIDANARGPSRGCELVRRYHVLPPVEGTTEPEARQPSGPWERFDDLLDRQHRRDREDGGPATLVRKIRTRLVYLVPSATAAALLVGLVLTLVWLLEQFGLSIDAAAFGAGPAILLGLSPFEILFRFAVLGALCATLWSLHRFLSVWRLLAELLSRVAESPLASAFSRLPPAKGGMARIQLFDPPSTEIVDEAIREKWDALELAAGAPGIATDPLAAEMMLQDEEAPRARWQWGIPPETGRGPGEGFRRLYRALCAVWRAERVPPRQPRATADADAAKGDTSPPPPSPRQRWMRTAEELAAIYVVDYIEWVFRYLRRLAAFLAAALVLMMITVASYPFQPASVVRTIYFGILGVAVLTIVAVLVRMNRDTVLSAITGTTPGEVTWDSTFILNLVTYAAIPVLTLLGSQIPALRDFLFSWVSPALRAFIKT